MAALVFGCDIWRYLAVLGRLHPLGTHGQPVWIAFADRGSLSFERYRSMGRARLDFMERELAGVDPRVRGLRRRGLCEARDGLDSGTSGFGVRKARVPAETPGRPGSAPVWTQASAWWCAAVRGTPCPSVTRKYRHMGAVSVVIQVAFVVLTVVALLAQASHADGASLPGEI